MEDSRQMVDMDDFDRFRNELNMSFTAGKSNSMPLVEGENAMRKQGAKASDKKMSLVPRLFNEDINNKSKNKRGVEKPKP